MSVVFWLLFVVSLLSLLSLLSGRVGLRGTQVQRLRFDTEPAERFWS